MAKQRKLLPGQKPSGQSRSDESLSLRSAESLGRVIGTLQRQIDGAVRLFSNNAPKVARRTTPSDETPAPRRKRPRLAASADPSPSRHPRKAVSASRSPVRSAKAVKRAARPK